MTTNAPSNSSRRYINQKGNYKVQIELVNESQQPAIFVTLLNNSSKDIYALKIDSTEIERNKQLSRIFQNVAQIYEEITRSFNQLDITDSDDSVLLITFEVAMGSFRRQKIELTATKKEGQQLNPLASEHSPLMLMEKVPIDKAYHKDFNIFKEEMIAICDKMSKSELARKITQAEKWQKNKLKNMFITFSNVILKQYRKNTCLHDPKTEAKYVKFREENKFLIQKNELLHNIYKKAVENTKQEPVPDLQIDFHLPIPKHLTVVLQNQSQVALQEYLPSFDEQKIKKKIDFYQRKNEQLLQAERQINLIREKRLEDIDNWFFDQKRKEKRLSIKGRKSQLLPGEVSPHFRQF